MTGTSGVGTVAAPKFIALAGETFAAPASRNLSVVGRLRALDGVRGLAILMVLLVHFNASVPVGRIESAIAGVTSYGSYGVDLFFILSGFLITGILYDTRNEPHRIRNFYMRRVLRIFPLYYGVLALIFFVAPLIPNLRGPTLDHLIENQGWAWLYAVNLYIARAGSWSLSYIEHFWSLAIEEQFYLFWPLIVFVLARWPRVLLSACLTLALAAMAGRIVGSALGLSWWTTYTFTPFRLDGLALGAFFAIAIRQPRGLELLARALLPGTAILAALLAMTFLWTRGVGHYGLELVLPVRSALIILLLGALVIWTLVAPERSLLSRFFRNRYLIFLGTYSYGLYVYHHFISYYMSINRTDLPLAEFLGSHLAAVFLQAALGVMASIGIAYLSYELFEKKFLRLKKRFDRVNETETPVESASDSEVPSAAPVR